MFPKQGLRETDLQLSDVARLPAFSELSTSQTARLKVG
jgi:hypothetical protein